MECLFSTERRRWLNRDPLGEASGLNVYAYVDNNPIDNIDPVGTNLIAVTASSAVGGAGHEGVIIGTPGNYTYYSYGPGLTVQNLSNATNEQSAIAAANVIRAQQGLNAYDRSFVADTTSQQDAQAAAAANAWKGSIYDPATNNCVEMVQDAFSSAGVPTAPAVIPNDWQDQNSTDPAVGARAPTGRPTSSNPPVNVPPPSNNSKSGCH